MSKKAIVSTMAAVCFLVLAVGCNKKAANDANLENGLNQFFQDNPECFWFAEKLPATYPGTHDNLDRLVQLGLLAKVPGPPYHAAGEVSPTFTYSLTDEGRKSAVVTPFMNSVHTNMCYAKRKVTKILSFTEPGQDNTTIVEYTWKLTDVASWANDPIVRRFYIPKDLSQEFKDRSQMILTNHGWSVQ